MEVLESSGKQKYILKKKKKEDGDIWVYICGGEKTREREKKKKKKGNVWMKERNKDFFPK